ncbi:glycosyltransferase family 4 protein [Streptomyces buecherae]|uniref:D-inositol 3-phosphate glycosyltransferase n=1 Tax=Streptomyces buecherae TaxID=2763006 RepID=A0A7H8NHU9_9ACTN|nr:glycosyltransferase family 4 protein [Streptomyces buecherae]QKW48226.1 glycosyltransferase family 4 protein [Streptomyces buecherae]QKW54104.1 glycosyltransferase family 4 protein [Streptomyces buecherae]
MRIMLIAEKYPPVVGGGETHVHQLAEGLAGAGHDVTVVTEAVPAGRERDLYRTGKARVKEVSGLVDACQRLACKDAVEQVHAEVSTTDADVVHVFNYVPALLVSWLRPAVRGRLVVSLFETLVPGVRVFDLWANYPLERALQRGLVDNLRPDLLLCGSRAYERWARNAGFTEPATVVEFGTDLTAFGPRPEARARWRAEHGLDDEPVFLVPARPVPRKRIEDALDALAALHTTHPQARMVLTAPTGRSNPGYVDGLLRRIDTLGLRQHVIWERGLGWQDMPTQYAAADAVVLPSSQEGWGIALTEGMASERPVITTDVEGHDEVVSHGETGLLYGSGDVPALVEAMRTVLDTDTSALVGRARREALARFSVEAVVRNHIRAYESLLGSA